MVATGRVVTITLDLPDERLSPNWHGDYRRRGSAVKQARALASHAAWFGPDSIAPFTRPVRLDVLYRRCDADVAKNVGRVCPRDEDNARACLKAACDGLVDSGLLRGDTAAHLRWGTVTITRCGHGKGTPPHAWRSGVVLTLTEEMEP